MYTSYKGDTTLNIIAIVDPIAQFFGIFVVPFFKRRILIISGGLLLGVILTMTGVLDNLN